MPVLVVQRGHVGRTSGATGTAGEQQMALAVSAEVVRLKPPDWTVRLIDADEPSDRYRGDYFAAIHGDGSSNPAVRGASVGYRSSGEAFGKAWRAAYAEVFPGLWHPDNYTRNLAGYYGLSMATSVGNARAIVIEVGTMTNPAERAWIDAHHTEIAASIWRALGEEVGVDLDYRHIAITDLGNATHRSALVAAAKSMSLAYKTGENTFYVDAHKDTKAPVFLRYAETHNLDCETVSTYRGQAATMVLRQTGAPVPSVGTLETRLEKAKQLGGQIAAL